LHDGSLLLKRTSHRSCEISHSRFVGILVCCGERSATICVVLGLKKSSTYSREYASGFSRPAASHLAAPPSPRYEQYYRNGS
jgi:hypothetical protein